MVNYRAYMHKDDTAFAAYPKNISPASMQASGVGGAALQGGSGDGTVHRCYRFFVDYSRCYAMALEDRECKIEWDDWMECKGGHKERARAKTILDQYRRNQQAAGKTRFEIRRSLANGLPAAVGLIQADADLERRVAEAPKGTPLDSREAAKWYNFGKAMHPEVMEGFKEYRPEEEMKGVRA